jgi:hypothetical protein
MEYLRLSWDILEPLVFLAAVFLFFRDPIRSWNFWGYRPTAVMGLFDPHLNKVLISKVNKAWSFNQGGMYENNIYVTVKNILSRELGIEATRFKLVYTEPLGKVRIRNKQALTRARISTVSIFPNLRGKGYLACYIRINLEGIEKDLRKGAGIQDSIVVSPEKAKELVTQIETLEHQAKKHKMILHMLSSIENFSSKMKEWESKETQAMEEQQKDVINQDKNGSEKTDSAGS